MHLEYPIAYLENHDFDEHGNFLINTDGKPALVLVQAGWCHHCEKAKPEFQKFANKNHDKVFCGTIEVDGERQTERELGKKIGKLKPSFVGFPDYLLIKDGKVLDVEPYGRDVKSLEHLIGYSMGRN